MSTPSRAVNVLLPFATVKAVIDVVPKKAVPFTSVSDAGSSNLVSFEHPPKAYGSIFVSALPSPNAT